MLNDNSGSLAPAYEQNNVPVVIAANNIFAPYAGVFIQSLLNHSSEKNNYDIIIFQRNISEENKRLLKSLATGYANVSIRFYDPSPFFAPFHYVEKEDALPFEIFYKIIAPHILNYTGRIIAVDADTLLKTDIAQLMDEDLKGCSVGGVCDLILNGWHLRDLSYVSRNMKVRDYFQNVCGLDNLRNYVNTGLLLFDCDKYVHELDIEIILNTAQQGEYFYPDQDTLNILMKNRITPLNLAWNVIVLSTPSQIKSFEAALKLYGGDCERAYENPYLLHWAGKPKPWVCADVPWGGEWWSTALRTPFVGHIIARMPDEQEKRRAYFRRKHGKEVDDIWEIVPKGIE